MEEQAASESRMPSESRSPPKPATDDDDYDESLQIVFAEPPGESITENKPSSSEALTSGQEVPQEPDFQI